MEEKLGLLKVFGVYYHKDPDFHCDPDLTVLKMLKSHIFLKSVVAYDLDDVYSIMQGENWSSGEYQEAAQKLVRDKGLQHTSMSIGDVVYDHEEKKYYQVDFVGFKEIRYGIEYKKKGE